MKYYLNYFIFLFVQLFVIRSKDSDFYSKNFYQKLLTTTISSHVLFKSRTTKITARFKSPTFENSERTYQFRDAMTAYQQSFSKNCLYTPGTDGSGCGTNKKSHGPIIVFCVSLMIFACIVSFIYKILGDIEVDNQNVTSSTMPSTTRFSRINNRSLSPIVPQNLIRTRALMNSTVSTELQLPENNNSNNRTTSTIISSSPPKYNDVMRESSVTIVMEQQSLLPPSYNDFMQRYNDRHETTSL